MAKMAKPHLKSAVLHESEIELAKISSSLLSSLSVKEGKAVEMLIKTDNHQYSSITLPPSVFKLLQTILAQMATGQAVTLAPVHSELSTQAAADLLNVSRPYLISLLEHKKIPFRKVGTRRRVLFQDLMDYKGKIENARRQMLDEMAKDST